MRRRSRPSAAMPMIRVSRRCEEALLVVLYLLLIQLPSHSDETPHSPSVTTSPPTLPTPLPALNANGAEAVSGLGTGKGSGGGGEVLREASGDGPPSANPTADPSSASPDDEPGDVDDGRGSGGWSLFLYPSATPIHARSELPEGSGAGPPSIRSREHIFPAAPIPPSTATSTNTQSDFDGEDIGDDGDDGQDDDDLEIEEAEGASPAPNPPLWQSPDSGRDQTTTTTTTKAPFFIQTPPPSVPLTTTRRPPPPMQLTPPPYVQSAEGDAHSIEMLKPGMLAAISGGTVIAILLTILLVMFVVYRLRKKDEGSYSLDEPRHPPSYRYAYQKAPTREFYA